MNFVIGDLHGEITKLKSLIKLIEKKVNNPSLIFLGDYIDKGENSMELLDYLIELKGIYPTIFLLGNHEHNWLNIKKNKNSILKYGGSKTIQDFKSKSIEECKTKILKNYFEIFDSLKTFYETENFFICHSGLSKKDLEEGKVENLNFNLNRYDFITSKSFFKKRKKIIFGHTAFFSPYIDEYKIGIDTGACYLKEQPITSLCLETKLFYNSNEEIYGIDKIRKDICPIIIR